MSKERNICNIPSCRNYQKYCRLHLNASMKEVKPIAKESDKRKELNKDYYKNAKKFVAANPVCQANIKDVCTRKAVCVHHKKGRNSKEDLMDEKFWLSVCLPCHKVIEENPAFSIQQGFSVSRHSKKVA